MEKLWLRRVLVIITITGFFSSDIITRARIYNRHTLGTHYYLWGSASSV